MRILVTGGAGFVGSNLVDQLIKEHEVTVWDNLITGNMDNVNKDAHFENIDVSNPIHGEHDFDIIYHLAALARIQPSFLDPYSTHRANIDGTSNILELARRCNSRVIYAGSSSFYHNVYVNPYSFTKWVGEECCKMYNTVYGTSVAIARFFNVYGPRQLESGPYSTVIGIFERQHRLGESLTVTGDGIKRRDFTHVSDIVSGLVSMGKQDWNGEIFQLGSGCNFSIKELAEMFESEIKYIPDRPGEAQDTLADISFSKEKLGWEPKMCLKDYVKTIK